MLLRRVLTLCAALPRPLPARSLTTPDYPARFAPGADSRGRSQLQPERLVLEACPCPPLRHWLPLRGPGRSLRRAAMRRAGSRPASADTHPAVFPSRPSPFPGQA